MRYLGYEILPLIDGLESLRGIELGGDGRRVDLGFGLGVPTPERTWVARGFDCRMLASAKQRRAIEAIFGKVGGAGLFWMPELLDLGVHAATPATSTSLIALAEQGLAETFATAPALHVMVLRPDGSQEPAQVTAVSVDGATEILTVWPALSATLHPERDFVCRLRLVRLTQDGIDWTFRDHALYEANLRLIEATHDYATLPHDGLAEPQQVWLYRFREKAGAGRRWHYTSFRTDLTGLGETWRAVPIEHSGVELNLNAADDGAGVSMLALPDGPLAGWEPRHFSEALEVALFSAQVPAYLANVTAGSERLLFLGEIESARRSGSRWEIDLRTALGRRTRLPRFQIQTRCQYPLGEAATCKLDLSAFKISGTIAALDPLASTLDLESPALATREATYLAGGKLKVGHELRSIRDASVLAPERHRLTLNLPLTAAQIGDPAEAWPGCDRTPDACRSKFDNFANFGGFPFVPAQNPTLKAVEVENPESGGGKK